MSVNPGNVGTETILDYVRPMRLVGGLAAAGVKALMLTPAQGAHTPLYAATSRAVRNDERIHAGSYLVPFGELEKLVGDAASVMMAEKLWIASSRIVDAVLARSS